MISGSGSGSDSNSDSDPDSTTIIIPNPASLIPHNPSVGLIWGPLTPASDNLPALYTMIGLQFFIGYGFFKMARNNLKSHLFNGKRYRNSIPKGLLGIILGSGCIFGSGLELTRLSLPYDPWYDEAKHYRRVSLKNGVIPSNWFGGYKFYKPMDFNTWLNKLNTWIKNVEASSDLKSTGFNLPFKNEHKINHKDNELLSRMNTKGKYHEIYKKLHDTNQKRYDHLLTNDLVNVNENNKGIRLDEILEGKSTLVNPEYTKPNIQLGNHTIEGDDEFEMVWVNFDPWDELKLETDYDIRLIPRCTTAEEQSEVVEKKNPLEVGEFQKM